MARYPGLPRERVIRTLIRLGFYVKRECKGHTVMRRDEPFAQTVVPRHPRVKPNILADIVAQCGITLEQFLEALSQEPSGAAGLGSTELAEVSPKSWPERWARAP